MKNCVFFFCLLFFLNPYSNLLHAHSGIDIPAVDSLITLSESTTDVEKKIEYLRAIIVKLVNHSRWDLAENYAKQLVIVGDQVDYCSVVYGYLYLGMINLSNAKYLKAIDCLEECLRIEKATDESFYTIHIYGNLGKAYYGLEDFDRSLEYQLKAYNSLLADGNYNLMCYVSTEIGDLYRELGQKDKALTMYRQSFSYSKNSGDNHKMISDAARIARCFVEINQLDSAQYYIQYGWDHIETKRVEESRLNLLKAEFALLFKEERYELALKKGLEVYRMIDKLAIGRMRFEEAINLAKVYEKLDRTDLAIQYTKIALAEAERIDARHKKAKCYKMLSAIYEHDKDFKQAYLSQKKWQVLEDSISDEKFIRRFEKMEINNAIDKQKYEDQVLIEKEKTKNQNLFWSLLGMGLVSVLLGAGSFIYYQLNRRNEQTSSNLTTSNSLLQVKTNELKKSNESLKQFSFTLSHDILVKVDRIISLTGLQKELLSQANEAELEQINHLYKAHETSLTLKEFCLDLISYFQLSEQNETLEEVDLNEIYLNVLEDLDEANKSEVQFQKELLPTIIANEKQMYQVFLNIFSNAIKFKKNKSALVLDVKVKEEKEDYIIFVTDNGIGINSDNLENIFDPFFRSENGIEGTGLGLAICKRIMENLGGNIWAESKLGEGTTMFISFPK